MMVLAAALAVSFCLIVVLLVKNQHLKIQILALTATDNSYAFDENLRKIEMPGKAERDAITFASTSLMIGLAASVVTELQHDLKSDVV